MSHSKRVTFSNSVPVQQVADTLPEGQTMASRMATITERYAMLCACPPVLNESENAVIQAVLSPVGVMVTPNMIRSLDALVAESSGGTSEQRIQLAGRIRKMPLADRIALIESRGR